MDATAEVYRAPMRSRDDAVAHDPAVGWALAHDLVGVGGLLSIAPGDAAEAVDALTELDPRVAARLRRFVEMPVGSFAWTRGSGSTWLGRVTGPWRYDASATARTHDLTHVRACRWLDDPVPADLVPDAVLATFARGGRNFQRIHDRQVGPATERVWADRVDRG